MIYLDNNATTELSPASVSAMCEYMQDPPQNSQKILQDATRLVYKTLGVDSGKVIYTSGGTENAAIAFSSALYTYPSGSAVCSLADHISVLNQHSAVAHSLKKDVTILPITQEGQPNPDLFNRFVSGDTSLVTMNLVNSETGVICTDIPEMAVAARHKSNALLYLDACQGVGRLDLTDCKDHVDMIGISAHKFHGPRGVGALWVRPGIEAYPAWGGGFQQAGYRSGTENTIGIVGMSAALEDLLSNMCEDILHVQNIRQIMDRNMLQIQDTTLNFGDRSRVCNTSSYLIKGVDTKVLRLLLHRQGVIVSDTTAGLMMTSAVSPLMTFLHSEEDSYSNLRLSICKNTTKAEVETATAEIAQAVKALRKLFPKPFPGVSNG